MAVPSDTVGLAISVAAGLVKLGGRVDRILAEQAAVRSDLALVDGAKVFPPLAAAMVHALEDFLQSPAAQALDAAARAELEELVARQNPLEADLLAKLRVYVPEAVKYRVENPDGDFAKKLDALGFGDDEDVWALAFCLAPGVDLRDQKLAWQLGTAVVSVLTEFAIENQNFLIRDERARPVLAAVLSRFGPGVGAVGSWNALLNLALRATVDGVLEVRGSLAGDTRWLGALLDGLATAKGAQNGDEFVLGLVRGRGYRSLVVSLLQEGSQHLARGDAKAFEKVAGAVLNAAAPLAANSPNFRDFFAAHWSDLLQAGLASLDTQGPALLDGADPLLSKALLAAIKALADAGQPEFLNGRVLQLAAASAIQAVVTDPKLLESQPEWMRLFLGSVSDIAKTDGLRLAVSPAGLEQILRVALQTLSTHPELLVRNPGLAREVVRGVLTQVAAVETPGVDALAQAAAIGALDAITRKPELLGIANGAYARVVADLAGWGAQQIADGRLDRAGAAEILALCTDAIAANPDVFLLARDALAREVLDRVLAATSDASVVQLGRGAELEIADAIFSVLAVRGRGLLAEGDPATLAFHLQAIVQLGLALSLEQVGRRLGRAQVPAVLELFVDAWARGSLPTLDRGDPHLQQAFLVLADQVSVV